MRGALRAQESSVQANQLTLAPFPACVPALAQTPAPIPGWGLIFASSSPTALALPPRKYIMHWGAYCPGLIFASSSPTVLGPGHRSSPCLSPSPNCPSATHGKHLEDLDTEESEALSPAVDRQQEGEVSQVLGEKDDQENGAGGRNTKRRWLVGCAWSKSQG